MHTALSDKNTSAHSQTQIQSLSQQQKNNKACSLYDKIQKKQATVGIVGLGYVGLPLATLCAKKGFLSVGLDLLAEKVRRINDGYSPIDDLTNEELNSIINGGQLRATTNWDELVNGADVLIICVPTPFNKNKEPDLSCVTLATEEIASRLRVGQLVILESTTYPGTTEELMLPILENSGLKVGQDFFLAYSPERIDPGNPKYKVQDIPKVVGGVTAHCRDLACLLYSSLVPSVNALSSPRAAEMTKLLENIFRNVNIALINELTMLCDRMKIDIWEVIEAAATKPFGFMPFSPGPGVGGHCIPVDPAYLSWKAREHDFYTNFIDLAAEINLNMPYFAAKKLLRLLYKNSKQAESWKVLILGVTFKENVSDLRNSSALKLMQILQEEGIALDYHDPYIQKLQVGRQSFYSVALEAQTLANYHCVAIHTKHDSYDWGWVTQHARMVFDMKNATRHVKSDREKIFKL